MCSLSVPGKPAQPIWILKALSNQFSPFVLTAALPTRTSPPPHSRYFSTSTFLTHQHPSSPNFQRPPPNTHAFGMNAEGPPWAVLCAQGPSWTDSSFCSQLYQQPPLYVHCLQTTVGPCASMVLSSSLFAEVVGSSTPLPTVQIPLILRDLLSCHPICEAISDALSLLDSWLSICTSPRSLTVPIQPWAA